MKRSPSAGFTLIEVLIVSLLLFFLAATLFQSVRATVGAKEDIDAMTQQSQTARASLSLIERDIAAAYLTLPEDLGWDATRPTNLPAGEEWIPPVRPANVAIFQGKANEIFMSSRTHQRLSQDSREDEEHFVTYQLDGDELIRAESKRAVNLYDREDPSKFRDFTLLKKVSNFVLSYWDKPQEKWLDSWDSEGEQKDRLPDAVKIHIEYAPDIDETSRRRKPEKVVLETAVRPPEAVFHFLAKPQTGAAGQQGTTTNPRGEP